MQYSRNDIEFSRGMFRVRGDTIDVFPAENADYALRIEMFDDEIENDLKFVDTKIREYWNLTPNNIESEEK